MSTWPTIESLVLRYQAGDRDAGSEAIAAMEPMLMALASHFRVDSVSDRDDFLQEARIAAAEAMARWDPERLDLRRWVKGCVWLRLTTYMAWHLRESRRREGTVSLDENVEMEHGSSMSLYEQVPDPAPSIDERLASREALADAVAWLRVALSANEQRVLWAWLGTCNGRRGSLSEVARVLGIPTKRVDNLLNKARRKAKGMLALA